MKLYDYKGAPNPRRVRIYLAEKGIEVPLAPVDLPAGETRSPEFRQKSPLGKLPVLELDDGTCRTESLAIMEYFEELHPEPPMIGTTPEERLRVRGLDRLCELGVAMNLGAIVVHTHRFFARRVTQHQVIADSAREPLRAALEVLDAEIGDRPFVAGDRPTIADCTLYAHLDFGRVMNAAVDLGPLGNVARWFEEFAKRPSAAA